MNRETKHKIQSCTVYGIQQGKLWIVQDIVPATIVGINKVVVFIVTCLRG